MQRLYFQPHRRVVELRRPLPANTKYGLRLAALRYLDLHRAVYDLNVHVIVTQDGVQVRYLRDGEEEAASPEQQIRKARSARLRVDAWVYRCAPYRGGQCGNKQRRPDRSYYLLGRKHQAGVKRVGGRTKASPMCRPLKHDGV